MLNYNDETLPVDEPEFIVLLPNESLADQLNSMAEGHCGADREIMLEAATRLRLRQ